MLYNNTSAVTASPLKRFACRGGSESHGNESRFITKMPLFTNGFLQRRIAHRKLSNSRSEEESFSGSTITLNLGALKQTFEKGQWSSQHEPQSAITEENATLRKAISHLEEENNLLKLKNEVLLDMV